MKTVNAALCPYQTRNIETWKENFITCNLVKRLSFDAFLMKEREGYKYLYLTPGEIMICVCVCGGGGSFGVLTVQNKPALRRGA